MDNDENILKDVVTDAAPDTETNELEESSAVEHASPVKGKCSRVSKIVDSMELSDSIATSAKAILEPLENGVAPGENIVKLVINALSHDEDVKNAEQAGYLRGRNEVIDEATKSPDNPSPQPVNFPVYRKRSFWD